MRRVYDLRGWQIRYNSSREVWEAARHGVGMNNRSYDDLIRMILERR